MKTAQTSDRVSSIAARYANLTPERLLGLTAKNESTRRVAADIRSMAASLLRQDEQRGLRGLWRKVTGVSDLKVVPLKRAKGCEDVPATLRVIADEIEAGDYWDDPITTAVLIVGYETEKPDGDDITLIRTRWSGHGMGPRHGFFQCKGLLACALNRFEKVDD